jgi:two-component system OmpR family response regulator
VRTILVDDDPAFRRLASMALTEAGVEHDAVGSAPDALRLLEQDRARYDMMLLDQELPGMRGEELLQLLRSNGHDIPIVLVTVRDQVSDKVRALQLGADDYIVKPFQFQELVARVRAVLRRCRGNEPIRLGALEIDPMMRQVTRDGEPVDLTPREFEILLVLVQGQERTVSRKELLRRVWSMSFEPGTNFIQVHVSRLRTKLGPIKGFRIETIRGQGYRLVSTLTDVDADAAAESATAGESAPCGPSPSPA